MIIPVYQPLGASTHLLAQKVGEQGHTKATHTGTLDPMAEGVVVILTAEDRFKKAIASDWKKTYAFSILWGVATDSLDLLGLIRKTNRILDSNSLSERVTPATVTALQQSYIGQFEQEMPSFSAKRIGGKSSFDFAKTTSEIPVFTQKIEIYSFHLLEFDHLFADDILKQLNTVIPHLKNDFRQDQILAEWGTWAEQHKNTPLLISRHVAETSKRTYIRGLVRDLSAHLDIPATTFHINRTANGPYQTKDCVCLI